MTTSFSIARLPRIEFGEGSRRRLPEIATRYGRHGLLVTGKHSLRRSPYWEELEALFSEAGLSLEHRVVHGEPSPELVDAAVAELKGKGLQFVMGIGGGSVLDAAKAIAGLLAIGDSVMDYLEGVGPERPYEGPALPFIAVPTTAGTGSEATKNAVLSRHGADGFKKSFRDEQLVPEFAVVDPDLYASCPPELIAANGMDAFTQLLESFVSIRANPLTDTLAISGMEAVRDGLLAWHQGDQAAAAGRTRMAYAALLSGITLAQTGLGSVHGLASPLGAFFPIPHGVVCGTLMAEAVAVNIECMERREPDNPALGKYARAATILTEREFGSDDDARRALVALLRDWTRQLALPGLGKYGITENDFPHIVAHCRGSSMKTNPVVLTDDEVAMLLARRI